MHRVSAAPDLTTRSNGLTDHQARQRVRVLDAMARVARERGYDSTTVADVVGQAGVSRRTFYGHFDDKRDCFVQGCWHGIALPFGAVDAPGSAEPDGGWRHTLRCGIWTLLDALVTIPDYTWIITIDSGAVRPAQAARAAMVEKWVDLLASLGDSIVGQEPGAQLLPRSTYRGVVGGIEVLVRKCLLESGIDALPDLADDVGRDRSRGSGRPSSTAAICETAAHAARAGARRPPCGSTIVDLTGREERVEQDGYAEQEPPEVARQLIDSGKLIANVLSRLDPKDWEPYSPTRANGAVAAIGGPPHPS